MSRNENEQSLAVIEPVASISDKSMRDAFFYAIEDRVNQTLQTFNGSEEEQIRLIHQEVFRYALALRRGSQPYLLLASKQGEVSFPEEDYRGIAVAERKIKINPLTGKYTWSVQPATKDPFERVRFRRQFEETGRALVGEGHYLNEPLIISEMVALGLKEEERAFSTFKELIARIRVLGNQNNDSGRYYRFIMSYLGFEVTGDEKVKVKHDKFGLNELLKIDSKLFQVGGKDNEKQQTAFTNEYFNRENGLIKNIPELLQLMDDIEGLKMMFLRNRDVNQDGLRGSQKLPEYYSERPRLENSLVVELITNPDKIQYLDPKQKEPLTTTSERIEKVRTYMSEKIEQLESGDHYTIFCAQFADVIINSYGEELDQYFQRLTVRKDFGRSYFKHLILDHLLKYKEIQYKSPDRNTYPDKIYYSLPEIKKRAGEKEPQLKQLVTSFWETRNFQINQLNKLTNEELEEFFKNILTPAMEGKAESVEEFKIIGDRLFGRLGISLNPKQEKFHYWTQSKKYKTDRRVKETFLHQLNNYTNEENPITLKLLELELLSQKASDELNKLAKENTNLGGDWKVATIIIQGENEIRLNNRNQVDMELSYQRYIDFVVEALLYVNLKSAIDINFTLEHFIESLTSRKNSRFSIKTPIDEFYNQINLGRLKRDLANRLGSAEQSFREKVFGKDYPENKVQFWQPYFENTLNIAVQDTEKQ